MKKQAIIVLSGGIGKNGKIPFFVKKRLDLSYKYFHSNISSRILLPGKWGLLCEGKPKLTEAKAMAAYLESLGVPSKNLFLEERSQDLIGSAYYLKKLYLNPRRLHNVLIIGSDFQEERAEFVFSKVLGPKFTVGYRFVSSQLTPELLWEFFTYERAALLKTKAFLTKMKTGEHTFLDTRLYRSRFYREGSIGQIRKRIFLSNIGRQTRAEQHYSLKTIYKEKASVFAKYALKEKKPNTLKADFWSGRFLNFVGRDQNGVYYALKFVLNPKDKQRFVKEAKIIKALKKQQIFFVPTVVEKQFKKAPIWYLYKTVSGRIAGQFSLDYSFDEYFYKTFVKNKFVDNLKKLRKTRIAGYKLSKWDSSMYRRRFDEAAAKVRRHKDFKNSKTIRLAEDLFYQHINRLDKIKKYLSHNDLHPANIIVSAAEKKLYFIDFEHVALNNIAFDFCFGYLFSWDNPKFQQELFTHFNKSLSSLERQEFATAFPLVNIYFLLWFIHFIVVWKTRAGEARYLEAKKYVFAELKRMCKLIQTTEGKT